MKYLFPGFVLCCSMMIGAIEVHAGDGDTLPGETQSETPSEGVRKNSISNIPSMRIEEPDGTLRPLEDGMPKSRLNMEELEEVPDAGGGSMVNVEGRLRSILQLPEGSNQAVHGQASADPQSSKP